MMKLIIKATLVALIFILPTQSKAQQFTAESVKFIDDLESFLAKGSDRKTAKEFIAIFQPIWNGMSETDKQTVYTYSNSLVTKGARAYPEFYNYIHGIYGFFNNKHPQSAFTQYHDAIDKIFSGVDKKKYDKFLEVCDGLFNNGVIFENVNIKWRVLSKDYKFGYDRTPTIEFAKADLSVISKKEDSSLISNTTGVYKPLLETWQGEKGIVTWERTGLDKNTTYAELNKYRINLKTPGFDADSSLLHTPYFDQPLKGRVSDKLVNISKTVGVTYPKFQSYSKRLFIKEVFPNIDYEGGFALDGANLFGTGSPEKLSQLIIYKDGKKFITGYALSFIIKPDKIVSEKTRIVMMIDNDSITHPGIDFKYNHADQMVSFTRGEQAVSKAPFFDSYHQLDMKFETLTWKMGTPDVTMGPVVSKGISKANFESANYFSMIRYQQMMGMDYNHPALAIEKLYLRKDEMVLNLYDVCSALGGTKDMVLPVIFKLAEHGLLDVDTDLEKVYLKKKLFDYTRAAAKSKDFDVILFDSEAEGDNATLNLYSYDLTIKGVKKINLSDTQFVRVYPRNEVVSIKKNRSFAFDGIINAGSIEFFGSNFSFDYDEFKLNIVDCDSMRMRVWPLSGQGPQIRVKSVITGVKGVVTIDGKDNKAGTKRGFENYPIFDCNKESYVFYNKAYRGVYDSTKFYFKNEPFKMDSLDNFVNIALKFKGEFHSAGIFPVMKETIGVMPDYSLGFIKKVPEAGMKLYADKGIFKNEMRLSNKGLQGDGKISFLTSTAESDAFTFFPDSTNGVAKTYVNTESKTSSFDVPLISGDGCFVKYAPKEKLWTARSLEKPLKIYRDGDKVDMKGIILLRESGMTGRGRMYFNNAELSAKNFKLKSRIIDSDTASFKMKSYDLTAIALESNNVQAHVDFDKRVAEFVSNGESEPLQFKEVQYICFMDRFKWYMDREDVTFESDKKTLNIDSDLDLSGSNFFSVHPKQDSLNFMAPKARYDMKNAVVTCDKVAYLDIADARIIPDSQRVIIRKKAKMDEFKNAKIIANSVTKYHKIYNARVQVLARKDYEASGDYAYTDENNKQQDIHFEKIRVDTTFSTFASGEVPESAKFMLSPHFAFKGTVALKAIDVGLNFDGATLINSSCKGFEPGWLKFKGVVDPMNIEIPVADIKESIDGKVLGLGPVLNTDSVSLYTTFFSEKINKDHIEVITTYGILTYDKDAKEYKIGTKEKFAENTLPGNIVALNKDKCELRGDGKMNFGVDMGLFKVTPVGTLNKDLNSGKTTMNATLQFDFPFVESALEKMAEKINKFPDLLSLETSGSNLVQGLREMAGLEETNKMMEELLYKGKVKNFPDAIEKSIVISDVKLSWGTFITEKGEEQGWESKGKVAICNIYKEQVLKVVNMKVRILKRRTGDVIQLAIWLDDVTPEANFYYFTYNNGLLQAYSTDSQFNTTITETKDDKKKFKGERGVKDLTVTTLGSGGKAIGFITE